ncbi:DNA repair protein RadC [Paenibacillus sp. 7124]|uniref:DNA repair protein RadC n=1 Tax=Paenibacillus apii TaxID=1850370 RepID=A0A6M1PNH7_9BACL|nr:DNA repair protein RadC [Paenibacillus apii]NGM83383.1 DNA repair protein RadC [Paenibacillus apii]
MDMYSIKSALSDALCIKEDGYVMQELFNRFVSPYELLGASEAELIQIKGVGPARARQIVSTLKLARALNTPQEANCFIRKPEDVFQLMRYEIGHLMHEEFWALPLTTKNQVICKSQISIGSLSSAIVGVREVYRSLIQRAAASWIAIHNHPSQFTEPSQEDLQLTTRLSNAGELLGIEMLDHIILSAESFYSFKEHGLM